MEGGLGVGGDWGWVRVRVRLVWVDMGLVEATGVSW